MLTHLGYPTLLAAALALLPVACSTVPASPGLERACRVHRTLLLTVDGFGAPPGVIVDPGVIEVQALARYPHFIQSGASLARTTDHPTPSKITYCAKCEAAVKTIRGLQRI